MKIGGQIIFAGTLGHQSHKLVEYFQAIPGVPKIRNGYNPATWALDLTSSAEIQLNVDYAQIYANSALYEQQLQDLLDLSGGLYAVVLFLGAVNINTVQPIVAVERTVFYRERAAGMYSSLPYALSQVAIESIYIAIQTSIYALILYPAMGFEGTASKFLWFYYFLFMSFIYFILFGMMTMALTPTIQISAILIYFFTCLWNLFSGFVIPRPQIPIWCRWYYWANPLSWTLYGLLTSQIGQDNDTFEMLGGGNMMVEGFIKENFGYDYDFLPVVAIAHVGWILIFFLAFVYAIKFLNFQHI